MLNFLLKIDHSIRGKFIQLLVLSALILNLGATAVLAAPTTANIDQNRQNRQQAEEREKKEQQKDVFMQKGKIDATDTSLPEEDNMYLIKKVILEGDSVEKFPWTAEMLDAYADRKIGIQGINLIIKRLTNAFINKGYITTRIVVPEQDLNSGELKLTLIPGRIGEIKIDEKCIQRNWHNAFPTQPGDIFNLRNIEQGLEQMKRVPSQEVDIKVVPGQTAGTSDIVLTVKQTEPGKVILSIDDSGIKATGRLQTSVTYSLDNLFNMNDLFNISVNGDYQRQEDIKGTRGNSAYYSVPNGATTYTFSSDRYRYHQTIVGKTQSFVSSGTTADQQFGVTQLLHRDQNSKTNLELGLLLRQSKSYLDDIEIDVQRRDTAAFKVGISHRRYIDKGVLNIELDNKTGVGWFGAQLDDEAKGPPTTRYSMWLLDASYITPVKIGSTDCQYSLVLHGQYTKYALYATDCLSIGGRYTVRGFDGENNLTAEQGWYIENTLTFPIDKTGVYGYIGLDAGKVYGPSAIYLDGSTLVGAVLGLKGGTKDLSYDVFIGKSLFKPHSFVTAKPTMGFKVVYQL